jgi:hypothetical protein
MFDFLVGLAFVLTVAGSAILATLPRSIFLGHESPAKIGSQYARSVDSD